MTILDGDILRISANFELGDGTQYQNIYHVIRDGTDPQTDSIHVATIKTRIESMYAAVAGQTPNDVTSQLCFVDRIEFNEIVDEWRVVENIGTFTPDFTPTNVNDAIPFQGAPFLIFKTQRPKSVGKKFLFPFGEDQQGGTILTSPALTALVAYGVQVLLGIAVAGDVTLTFGIVRTGIQTWYNFLVAVANDVIGSQKRRRPGVGA